MPAIYRLSIHIGTDSEGLKRDILIRGQAQKEGLTVSEWINKAIDKALKAR